jgi:hypothetical protein
MTSPDDMELKHPEGAVYQHPSGNWYVRENGSWRLMTAAEIAAMETPQ